MVHSCYLNRHEFANKHLTAAICVASPPWHACDLATTLNNQTYKQTASYCTRSRRQINNISAFY